MTLIAVQEMKAQITELLGTTQCGRAADISFGLTETAVWFSSTTNDQTDSAEFDGWDQTPADWIWMQQQAGLQQQAWYAELTHHLSEAFCTKNKLSQSPLTSCSSQLWKQIRLAGDTEVLQAHLR